MEINEVLLKLRVNKSLSQQNIADELGVDISTYSRYEKGKAELKISHAKKLADLYKISLDELISYGEAQAPSKAASKENQVAESIDLYLKRRRQKMVALTVELDGTAETVNHYMQLIQDLNKVIATQA